MFNHLYLNPVPASRGSSAQNNLATDFEMNGVGWQDNCA
jgi:hypothetical protein